MNFALNEFTPATTECQLCAYEVQAMWYVKTKKSVTQQAEVICC